MTPATEVLVFILPLLTILLAVWYFWRARRRKPKKEKVDDTTRQERAVWAWAKILSSAQGPVSSFGVSKVEMELDVHLPGTAAYPAKVTWLVDKESLGFVETGQELSLKVDPLGPDHIFPNGSWAKPIG